MWSKIDRVMVNSIWSSLSLQAHVHFSNPGAFSNHYMASIYIGPRQDRAKRSFKFFNMEDDHSGFLKLISKKWAAHISGSCIYILCKRLNFLKGPLYKLNRLHFSHISERVARAESELDCHQTLL